MTSSRVALAPERFLLGCIAQPGNGVSSALAP